MKKGMFLYAVLLFCIGGFLVQSAFSQVSVDPSDDFYRQVQSWELRGLVHNVPPMRPYPLPVVKKILSTIIEEQKSPHDVALAEAYWQRITGKSWYASLEAEATLRHQKSDSHKNTDVLFHAEPSLSGDVMLYKNLVSLGYSIGVSAFSDDQEDFLASYSNPKTDGLEDPASLGPLEMFIDANDVLSIGTESVYAQLGIYRSGFGAFLGRELGLNDSAHHRTSISFTALRPKWSFFQQLSVIGATTNYDDSVLAANKFLAFHALTFDVTKKFSVSYFEGTVFGRRLDPSYVLPVPYYIAEVIGGWGDSLLMGLNASYMVLPGLLVSADMYVDDFDLNKFFKLDLDAKNRLALMLGAVYTPSNSLCQRVGLDYTLITPYMYTHWDYSTADGMAAMPQDCINYQNYTNNGLPIGSSLPPNSDALSLTIDFTPLSRLHVQTSVNFVRHANVCESLTTEEALRYLLAEHGVYATDGSIFTHSMFENTESRLGDHVETAWEHLNLFTQDHKMYVLQAGISGDYTFKRYSWGQVSFTFSYLFEYIKNKGVDSHLYSGGHVQEIMSEETKEGTGFYTIDDSGSYTAEEVVQQFKAAWVDQFSTTLSHYVSFGVTFVF